jgi:hypothetical protein
MVNRQTSVAFTHSTPTSQPRPERPELQRPVLPEENDPSRYFSIRGGGWWMQAIDASSRQL